MTAVSGSALSAADFNTYVRDNLNMTMPALATDDDFAAWFVATGTNALAKRNVKTAEISTSPSAQSTTSTSFTDLSTVGPSVTLTTGTRALVMINCWLRNDTTNASASASFAVSGATTLSALDVYGLNVDGLTASNPNRKGSSYLLQTLNAGSNTFTMKYKVGSNTGEFNNRRIVVWAF